jgi:hypothetical protein
MQTSYSHVKFTKDVEIMRQKLAECNSFLKKGSNQRYRDMPENSGQQRVAIRDGRALLEAVSNGDPVPLVKHLILRTDLKDEFARMGVSATPFGLARFVSLLFALCLCCFFVPSSCPLFLFFSEDFVCTTTSTRPDCSSRRTS